MGLLAVGFALPRMSPSARCALTAPFHPYRLRGGRRRGRAPACVGFAWPGVRHRNVGGMFSVALSLGLRRVGVTNHRTLSSSDFPPDRVRMSRRSRRSPPPTSPPVLYATIRVFSAGWRELLHGASTSPYHRRTMHDHPHRHRSLDNALCGTRKPKSDPQRLHVGHGPGAE